MELSRDLNAIAVRNVEDYRNRRQRCKNIELVHQDDSADAHPSGA
jgi:hypothetical protein